MTRSVFALTQNEYEFYCNDAESVQIIANKDGSLYHGRARAVKGGVLIFLPSVEVENLK